MRKLSDILEGLLDADFDTNPGLMLIQQCYEDWDSNGKITEIFDILDPAYNQIPRNQVMRKLNSSPVLGLIYWPGKESQTTAMYIYSKQPDGKIITTCIGFVRNKKSVVFRQDGYIINKPAKQYTTIYWQIPQSDYNGIFKYLMSLRGWQ